MDQRGFKSCCRVCGCWSIQNRHWVKGILPDCSSSVSLNGYWEECSPLDNLEYLEWCLEHKNVVSK